MTRPWTVRTSEQAHAAALLVEGSQTGSGLCGVLPPEGCIGRIPVAVADVPGALRVLDCLGHRELQRCMGKLHIGCCGGVAGDYLQLRERQLAKGKQRLEDRQVDERPVNPQSLVADRSGKTEVALCQGEHTAAPIRLVSLCLVEFDHQLQLLGQMAIGTTGKRHQARGHGFPIRWDIRAGFRPRFRATRSPAWLSARDPDSRQAAPRSCEYRHCCPARRHRDSQTEDSEDLYATSAK